MVPLDPMSCEFGKWYYSIEKKLKKYAQFEEVLEKIEVYLEIYKIYFIELKRSWLMSKIIDSPKEASVEQQKRAYMHFDHLEEVSDKLMKEFDNFEMSLRLLKEEDLQAIF